MNIFYEGFIDEKHNGKWMNGFFVDDGYYCQDVWDSDLFESREEAIKNGIERCKRFPNGVDTNIENPTHYELQVGKVAGYYPQINVNLDSIILSAQDQANDSLQGMEEIEGLFHLTQEQRQDLQDILQKAFESWLKKYNLCPLISGLDCCETINIENYIC